MNTRWAVLLLIVSGGSLIPGCAHQDRTGNRDSQSPSALALQIIKSLEAKYAPDEHLAIYHVGMVSRGGALAVTGEVDRTEAKFETLEKLKENGIRCVDRIEILPSPEMGPTTWGIVCLSVASGREKPDHKAEMGTQLPMGGSVRIWKFLNHWFYVQSEDGYLSWVERDAIVRCSREQVEQWQRSSLSIVTAFNERVLEEPRNDAEPVSDLILGNLVRRISERGPWLEVELANGRKGYLNKDAAQDYAEWKQTRPRSAEQIERTARTLLGRPYLWGGTSPSGLDCSGFAKLVFSLNGINLNRNASEQARQGRPVPIDPTFSQLRKGDLLFFGANNRQNRSDWITHVAIYLGNMKFIQSSQKVRISSLDPASELYDERHARTLVSARRLLQD